MQATVRTFDPGTGSGTVLTDDGIELTYDGDAFARSGLRRLRIGQRVRILTGGTDERTRVSSLTIYTLSE